MEEDGGVVISENGGETLVTLDSSEVESELGKERGGGKTDDVLRFLDSLDGYLTLVDSLNSTLQEGWLDLASARHSMGTLRINSTLLDLNFHPAATTLQVTEHDVDSMGAEPLFTLSKWTSNNSGKGFLVDAESKEGNPHSPTLRHRGCSREKLSPKKEALLAADDQGKKERAKSLSVFGTLVSPKLRSAQLSFETALETLVEIANTRSAMLSAFEQVQKELRDVNR